MDFGNIGDILSSLSEDDISSLKETAAALFGESQEKKDEKQGFDFSSIDPAMIGKITKIMGLLNASSPSPRCDLIRALKPLLSRDKRKRADEAMQIMKLIDLLPIIQEFKL